MAGSGSLHDEEEFENIKADLADLDETEIETILNGEEKRFLLYVERGDVSSVKHIVAKNKKENAKKTGSFNLNCLDPLGRSALSISVENENMAMIDYLLEEGIDPADSLLYAINEEYVEGVEVLLEHEEKIHKPGEKYSWQKLEGIRENYTADITPLILAAHKNNYEILKQLLDRGATLPMPHDVKCGCDECLASSADDSLRHSLARINAYKALCSPSLICLSSKDPFATAFSLTQELKNLARIETEFKKEYTSLRSGVTTYARSLIEQTRTSYELAVILNYDPEGTVYERGQRMHFANLQEAVECKQKKFVSHANVQQILGTVWYDGMPGFKRYGPVKQLMKIATIGMMFPLYCFGKILAPQSKIGIAMTKPFIKFIVHSSSYMCFLSLLVIVSLKVEAILIEMFGTEWMRDALKENQTKERGSLPSIVEFFIVVYVIGFIWGEIRSLWREGLLDYMKDLWNIVDFISNFLYVNWISLRMIAWYQIQREMAVGINPYMTRDNMHPFDPMLIAEGMFGAANIFSFLKLVHIFSVHPQLGPLTIALGRMVFDILKFFCVYTLVLFAFGCGLNQMLWYYADLDKKKCYSLPGGEMDDDAELSCDIWRRFSNLFETSQSLFWASFGLVDLYNFELTGIKSFTRFWGLLVFGSYNMINVIVLLNLLIAMMSNSFADIIERCDMEWKFARSKLWMSYFEEGDDMPSPFNLIPNPWKLFAFKRKEKLSTRKKNDEMRDLQYQKVTRNLVRRFVTNEQRNTEEAPVNEDDINEVKQLISTFKHDILSVLRINGMNTGDKHQKEGMAMGRKQQARERRLMKGFNIGMVEGLAMENIFHGKTKDVLDITDVVFKMLVSKKKKSKQWNSSVIPKNAIDFIGSSSIRKRRQSLRTTRRRNAWRRVQFYVRRGVFSNGEINVRTLKEAQQKMRREIRRPPPGWMKLQKHVENKTLTAKEAVERPRHMGWRKIQAHVLQKTMDDELGAGREATTKENTIRDNQVSADHKQSHESANKPEVNEPPKISAPKPKQEVAIIPEVKKSNKTSEVKPQLEPIKESGGNKPQTPAPQAAIKPPDTKISTPDATSVAKEAIPSVSKPDTESKPELLKPPPKQDVIIPKPSVVPTRKPQSGFF